MKGCTLEVDGVGYFPDAPTERGVKHLHELTKAVEKGFHTAQILFWLSTANKLTNWISLGREFLFVFRHHIAFV